MKNIKVVLICGGKGTRMPELTGGITPKSLIRLSKRVARPFIAYQLDRLKRNGVEEVLLVPHENWQIPILNHSIRVGEFPALKYSFELHHADHPFVVFRNKNVMKFIGKSDFIFSYGDISYSEDTLKKMLMVESQNNTSIGCGMYSKSARWRKGRRFLTFSKNAYGEIADLGYSGKADFTIHAPFFFQNRAIRSIREELKKKTPQTIPLLRRLIDKRQLSIIIPKILINMTTIEDAHRAEKILQPKRANHSS